jgi:hypothetical protein
MGAFLSQRRFGLAALLCAGLLAACQPQEGRITLKPDEKFIISRETWDYYQTYLQLIGSTSRGAFAVAEDGYYATFHYCPTTHGCYYTINYSMEAIKSCQSKGYKCIVFAKDDDIVVPYAIAE